MDLIVEKATELGATAIVPVRSDASWANSPATTRSSAGSASREPRRSSAAAASIPESRRSRRGTELLATFASYDRVYIPWELAELRPLRDTFEAEAAGLRIVLFVIGPEGGFSARGGRARGAAGAVPVSLGARILRTETVALAVLSAFAYARGEL